MKLSELLEFIGKGETLRVYSVSEKKMLYKGSKEGLSNNNRVTGRNIKKSGITMYRSNRWETGINVEVF